ncbi:hypothetical protein VTK73DRAFT_5953 [Phialemonium thermophilum]|uniref:Uncharacterized protein n=1 Tax=Phialemonium thermophilum TaxID=223376 RepID=A0ABR3WLF9_9PEZI
MGFDGGLLLALALGLLAGLVAVADLGAGGAGYEVEDGGLEGHRERHLRGFPFLVPLPFSIRRGRSNKWKVKERKRGLSSFAVEIRRSPAGGRRVFASIGVVRRSLVETGCLWLAGEECCDPNGRFTGDIEGKRLDSRKQYEKQKRNNGRKLPKGKGGR